MPDLITKQLKDLLEMADNDFGPFADPDPNANQDTIDDLTTEEKQILADQILLKLHRPRRPVPSI